MIPFPMQLIAGAPEFRRRRTYGMDLDYPSMLAMGAVDPFAPDSQTLPTMDRSLPAVRRGLDRGLRMLPLNDRSPAATELAMMAEIPRARIPEVQIASPSQPLRTSRPTLDLSGESRFTNNPYGEYPLQTDASGRPTPFVQKSLPPPEQKQEFFDLPSLMLMRESPGNKLVVPKELQGLEFKDVSESLPSKPVLSSGQPVLGLPGGYVPPPRFSSVGDFGDTAPLLRALGAADGMPDAPTGLFTRTFSSPQGVTSYDMTADGKYTGTGNVRGVPFTSLDDAKRAESDAAFEQGYRETGVRGVPSIESIMNNQLFGTQFGGLDGGMNQKRLAAAEMQQKMMLPLAAMERDRIQSDADVRRAELMRRDMTHNKLLDMAAFNAQRVREQGGSEEKATEAFNSTLRQSSMALPEALRMRLSANEAPQGNPLETARRNDLMRIIREGEYNSGSANMVLDRLAEVPPNQRGALIQELMNAGRHPAATGSITDFADEMAKSLAASQMRMSIDEPYRGDVPLPFRMEGNTIVMPNGRRIPVPYQQRPSALGSLFSFGPSPSDLKADAARRAIAAEFFRNLYGSNP